jgi:S-adenosylmethionine:tRNA ribosyltransferase-isomerase
VSALAFNLPADREARRPPELRGLSRDAVRMLVSDARNASHDITTFTAIVQYLRCGDLLVVNDSATLPAALSAQRANGATLALHLSTRISENLWLVEPRKTLAAAGERLSLPGEAQATLLAPFAREHARLWYAQFVLPSDMLSYLYAYGRPITYGYVDETYALSFYQTIFAREPGSVEMPSAGRPFSLRVLDALCRKGISVAPITLHCGVASPESHEPPLDERLHVPQRTARAVNATRRNGGRVIAAGTTVVRALETAADANGTVHALKGWTSHIVDPAHPPHVVDGLLTGLHEPRASHLNLLEAFVSRGFLADAYQHALDEGLLWHEFGDVHLLVSR